MLQTCAPAPAVIEVLFNAYPQLRVSESWREVIPEEVFQVREPPASRVRAELPSVSVPCQACRTHLQVGIKPLEKEGGGDLGVHLSTAASLWALSIHTARSSCYSQGAVATRSRSSPTLTRGTAGLRAWCPDQGGGPAPESTGLAPVCPLRLTLTCRLPLQAHRPFYQSLFALAGSPRRLLHLCRCAIRRRFGKQCFRLVPLLPLPATLQSYLLLEPEGVLR